MPGQKAEKKHRHREGRTHIGTEDSCLEPHMCCSGLVGRPEPCTANWWGLRKLTFFLSPSWMPGIRNQGVGRVSPWRVCPKPLSSCWWLPAVLAAPWIREASRQPPLPSPAGFLPGYPDFSLLRMPVVASGAHRALVWLHLFVLFCFVFRVTPTAYGASQARGQIAAVAASLHHSHSSSGSSTH